MARMHGHVVTTTWAAANGVGKRYGDWRGAEIFAQSFQFIRPNSAWPSSLRYSRSQSASQPSSKYAGSFLTPSLSSKREFREGLRRLALPLRQDLVRFQR
ncbi:hypothetical protein KC357_g54 [Hortaea werneckii]|nr:hypothetical protein KC357_g54 [Hortaea werneckii]